MREIDSINQIQKPDPLDASGSLSRDKQERWRMTTSVFVTRGVALAAVLLAAAETRAAPATVAFDNTGGGTAPLKTSLATMTDETWWFKVFTVGASNATISSMSMGMWSNTTNHNITWELYDVDGSDNPTGPVLASDTQSQVFGATGSGNVGYYQFTTGGSLASFSMQAGQTYGLLFKTDSSAFLNWTETVSEATYTEGGGFTYNGGGRTFDSGNNWSTSNYRNAWSMTVNASAVPGTGVAGLATVGLAGFARRRRR